MVKAIIGCIGHKATVVKTCPMCKKVRIHKQSESGKAGACYRCRDTVIPKHILVEQHKQYIKLYLKKKL